MASSSSHKHILSDSNCEKSCRLQYGISESFNHILLEQQKIKASKSHIQSKIFDDPNDKNFYRHMLDDVMFKTFDDPTEQKIFRIALEGMNRNYPEILKGEERNMFYCPSSFNFDSRIGKEETCVPAVLEDMQAELEAKQQSQPNKSNKSISNRFESSKVTPTGEISTDAQSSAASAETKKVFKETNNVAEKVLNPSKHSQGEPNQNIHTSVHSRQDSSQSRTSTQLSSNEAISLKRIQDHLKKLRPQLAEQEFVDALACFFYQQRGIFIHSLKLDNHLKVLTNKARDRRRQDKSLGFGLTDFERKLAEQMNISDQALVDTADKVVTHLLTKRKANTGKINGKVVREAIDDQLKGNDQTYVKKLFKPGQWYSLIEVKDGIMLGKFESDCRVAGENDIMIMLPDSKLFLCVEIKRHMKRNDPPVLPKSTSRIDKNMISASDQLKKNAAFISMMYGAILSPGWQFVKVCAISPTLYNSERICKNCRKFILTTDMLKTPGGLEKMVERNRIVKPKLYAGSRD